MQNLAADGLTKISEVGSGSFSAPQGAIGSNSIASAEFSRAGGTLPEAHGPGGPGFSDLLVKTLEDVNAAQQNADAAIKELVAGRTKNVHETMLAIEKADLSLKMMMQVRNKVIDAYREIMRMQV